jgi:cobalt-zinc-cadmium efflux system protein
MTTRFGLAFWLTTFILIAEVIGGLVSNSLALLGDAGHVFSDLVALGLSWYGLKQAERPSDFRMTYGYHRVGIFVAFVNAAVLIGISIQLVIEAYRRLAQPYPITADLMFFVGLAGLVVNLVVMRLLSFRASHNLNVQSAFLHVLGDTLGSVAVVASGLVIWLTGQTWVDSAASFFIAGVITLGSVRIIMRSVSIMLEASPRSIDMSVLVRRIYTIPGVQDVHHLHIWSLTPEILALSCHIAIDDVRVSEASVILTRLNEMLANEFSIGHSTVQFETAGYDPNELYCSLEPNLEPHFVAHPG